MKPPDSQGLIRTGGLFVLQTQTPTENTLQHQHLVHSGGEMVFWRETSQLDEEEEEEEEEEVLFPHKERGCLCLTGQRLHSESCNPEQSERGGAEVERRWW